MTPDFRTANRLVAWGPATAMIGCGITAAQAQQPKPQYDKNGRPYYGSNGPNVSYQQGNTRIFVSRRSWLDAGTEVLPGDRKFLDYAFPPEVGYPSVARETNTRPLARQPLTPPSDMGGYPLTIPLPN